MKKKSDKKKTSKKKKFVKPVLVTKVVTDTITQVYGTYGTPQPSGFGT